MMRRPNFVKYFKHFFSLSIFFKLFLKDPATNWKILSNELKIHGIIVNTFKKDWPNAFVEMHQYMKDVLF